MKPIANIVVEDNVPFPPQQGRANKGALRTALETMKPGQSFVVPNTGNRNFYLYRAAKKSGVKVCIRKINGNKLRVWKTGVK